MEETKLYLEFGDIGQGYGYKLDKNWDDISDDEVVYVPEYGIETDETGKEYAKDYYTKSDLIFLCVGTNIDAETLLNMLDWQFPETLLDELQREEDLIE